MAINLGNQIVCLATDQSVTQGVIIVGVCIIAISVWLYMRNLPKHIISSLVSDINSEKLFWSETAALDCRELSSVFFFLDKDKSGHVDSKEIM